MAILLLNVSDVMVTRRGPGVNSECRLCPHDEGMKPPKLLSQVGKRRLVLGILKNYFLK